VKGEASILRTSWSTVCGDAYTAGGFENSDAKQKLDAYCEAEQVGLPGAFHGAKTANKQNDYQHTAYLDCLRICDVWILKEYAKGSAL
jgi:hypothetical protein